MKPETSTPPSPLVSVRSVSKTYSVGPTQVHAVSEVSLDILKGEYLSIMGPSGCGKSTLFNLIGGLDFADEGSVVIDGLDIEKLAPADIAALRCRKIGYIFQTFNLVQVMTALENVMLPMIFADLTRREAAAKAASLLERVSLGDRLHHRPDQLSGGQQQRVAIARALANDPMLILADEPTGNLDLHSGEEIIGILRNLRETAGVTVITATHDHKMLAASDRVVYLADGRITDIKNRDDLDITFGGIQ